MHSGFNFLVARQFRLPKGLWAPLAWCLVGSAYAAGDSQWIGSWYAGPTKYSVTFDHATVRTIVHLTAGGDRLRVRLSNLYGRTALKVGAVCVAADAVSQKVTFHGGLQVTLLPGASAVSDPVDLKTSAGARLAVSVFYPESIPREITSFHNAESDTVTTGNTVSDAVLASMAKSLPLTYFLAGVDVEDVGSRGTIVIMGDSKSMTGAQRWAALLARRLTEAGKHYGVVDASIGGNRILRDSRFLNYGGESAGSRFDRDALSQPAVKYVILFEGANDLAVCQFDGANPSNPPVTAADITNAMRRLAERAHRHGVKLYVATLAPSEGAVTPEYNSPEKDKVRHAINNWIRTSKAIDGYIDFDHALADQRKPNRLNAEVDLGDHLHLNDAGQRAMSEAVDLSFFE